MCCPKRKQVCLFLEITMCFHISALSSIIFLLRCKIFVDVLARTADSADPLTDTLKWITEYFCQVTHPSSWRMYGLLRLVTKMDLKMRM